ncbi:MAG: inner membrane-spanning protein YciB [Pseudomonadota bacterium]
MHERRISPIVKSVLEIGPLIVFFIGYLRVRQQTFVIAGIEYDGFIVVTAAFIPLILLCTGLLWALTGKLSKMQIATAVFVTLLGGLGVWLNDDRFFKMKPTIVYLLFAAVLGFDLLRGRSCLKGIMEEMMPLQPEGWMILTRRMGVFFLCLALSNELVWRTMSTDIWVNFKIFGLTAASFVFLAAQGRLFQTYAIEKESE